ncbi:MAG: Class III stress response-related ATPase [Candidatus Uhrbacteria bacterium GW2011_GWA2_41_10]|nr:MAG: Class III stress response-related ATPase [Candidatus Uhrbacteria bacterium GW2011_GWA2_41_10]
MDQHIVEKFTTHLKNTLTRALCLAVEQQKAQVEPEHLLWALGTEKGSIAAEVLRKTQIKQSHLRTLANFSIPKMRSSKKITKEKHPNDVPQLSVNAKRAIEKAVLAASVHEHTYVGTEHLLSGLIHIHDPKIEQFFHAEKIVIPELRQHLSLVLKTASKFPELAGMIHEVPKEKTGSETAFFNEEPEESEPEEPERKTPALDFFGRDLTSQNMQARIDPLIGREKEVQRVMEILCRRTKNNPLLLGEPGVGKSAIVEGLAKKIAEGTVPAALQGKRIIALDLAMAIAGTMYRGESEARLRQIIEEAKTNEEIILFIDEIHMIVGAGSASGSLDAANMLKPALARGELRCIGATTHAEFKKHMETDAALERRFQTVVIEEPSAEDTLHILQGIAPSYTSFHQVQFTDTALQAAVRLSGRYLSDKRFPDKAIDLIDEAAASVRVRTQHPSQNDRMRAAHRELERIREQKREAVRTENFTQALSLKKQEQHLQETCKQWEQASPPSELLTVDEQQIIEIVSRLTHIPLSELSHHERERLLSLESFIQKQVIGQDMAVRRVAESIRRAHAGINQSSRPLASFLFLGPSGVGKTELARTVAETVFQNPRALIRLDMSEFAEGYAVSKLLGSPAGYVGYREPAKLTDQIKQRPYAVILFDEFEKAHTDVQNLLLQILENGEIADATGRPVSFRHAIVILTSNVGSDQMEGGHLGFAFDEKEGITGKQEEIRKALEERFRPELINRIDHVCIFERLTEEHLQKITEKQLEELAKRLHEQGSILSWSLSVTEHIASEAQKSKLRAREVRRLIQTEIESLLADHLLTSPEEKIVCLGWNGEHFEIKKQAKKNRS